MSASSDFGGRIELNNKQALLAMRQVSIASTRMASTMAASFRGAFAASASFATGVSSALRTTSQSFSRMSTKMAQWGAAMTGTFALITRSSFGMQKEMGALASLGFQSFSKMEKGALNLAATFEGIKARDVVAGAYDIQSALSSLGDDAIIELSKINALVAKATIADAKQTADLMTGVYASFSDSMKVKGIEFGKAFAGVTSTAVKQFKLTGPKIAAFFENAGASAAAAGFKFEETTAILGVLGQQIGGAEAGTAFRFLLDNIGLVQAKMNKLTKTHGIEQVTFFDEDRVKKLPQLLDAVDQALQAVSNGMEKSAANAERAEIKSLLFGARGGKVFNILRTKVDQLTDGEKRLLAARERGLDSVHEMIALMDQMPAAQISLVWQKLGVIIDKISLKLGKMLLPYVKQLNLVLDRVIKFVDENEEGFATIVQGIGAIGTALLGLAIAFKGIAIVTGLAATAFATLAIPLGAAGIIAGAATGIIAGLVGIVGAIVAGIPALVSGVIAIGSAFATIGLPAIIAAVVALGVGLLMLPTILDEIMTTAVSVFSDMVTEIGNAGERIGSTFIPILTSLGASIKKAFAGILDAFKAQDYKLAGEIAMAALDLAILEGTTAITVAWRSFVDELGDLLVKGLTRAATEAAIAVAKLSVAGHLASLVFDKKQERQKNAEQAARDKADWQRTKQTTEAQVKLETLLVHAKQRANAKALADWKAGAAREQVERKKRLAAMNREADESGDTGTKARANARHSATALANGGKAVTDEFGKVLGLAGEAANKFKQLCPADSMRDVMVNVKGGLDEFSSKINRSQGGTQQMPVAGMMTAVQSVAASTQGQFVTPAAAPAASGATDASTITPVVSDFVDATERNTDQVTRAIEAFRMRLAGVTSKQDEIEANVSVILTEPQE